MDNLTFEWDENKNQSNQIKHKIDFNAAKEIFIDKKRLIFEDKRKEYGERRWRTTGKMSKFLITVIYTYRNDKIRIISARLAGKKEREQYEKQDS